MLQVPTVMALEHLVFQVLKVKYLLMVESLLALFGSCLYISLTCTAVLLRLTLIREILKIRTSFKSGGLVAAQGGAEGACSCL